MPPYQRASQIYRPRVLANFRPDKLAKRKKPKTARDRREGMSEEHLALVRRLWCCVGTERYRIECHHLKSGAAVRFRGVMLKAPDRFVVPLFWMRHWELESLGSRREAEWFDDYGIDPYALADALWSNTGDLDKMSAVLEAHQEQAARLVARRNASRRFK